MHVLVGIILFIPCGNNIHNVVRLHGFFVFLRYLKEFVFSL